MSTEPTFERGAITFFSGRLTLKEAAAIFAHMPYELDYVNKNDEYVWYSPNPWRDNDRLQKRLTHWCWVVTLSLYSHWSSRF